jgi:hypothetical protein
MAVFSRKSIGFSLWIKLLADNVGYIFGYFWRPMCEFFTETFCRPAQDVAVAPGSTSVYLLSKIGDISVLNVDTNLPEIRVHNSRHRRVRARDAKHEKN